MEKILEKSKKYEYLVTSFDPAFNSIIKAIDIVKSFIIDNGLIVYGGTGLDYALRLHGDKIYPDEMLAIPDLDFYSPKNVEHSYNLADLLYKEGFTEVRAINAEHMLTMRVDMIDNHFIADITYIPPEIFKKLPYLEYNGMKIIHPLFQRIDIHSSLAFPYDNVPREVIFQRWSKDIKRFNKMNKHYPVQVVGDAIPTRTMIVGNELRHYVLSGFLAYAILYNEYVKSMKRFNVEPLKDIIATNLSINDKITFDTIDQKVEIMHFKPDKLREEIELIDVHKYEAYSNMIPARIEGTLPTGGTAVIYSTNDRLMSVNSIKQENHSIRIVNIQYLLKHFISLYFINSHLPKISNTYLLRYSSLLKMISSYEETITNFGAGNDENIKQSPLFPSVSTYGNENVNIARKVALNRLYNELDNIPKYKVPQNYYPCRNVPRFRHPRFDPSELEFFHEEGAEVSLDSSIGSDGNMSNTSGNPNLAPAKV